LNEYIFMPELVGLGGQNLSAWLQDNDLLKRKGSGLPDWLIRVFDVEKALKLEKDLRADSGIPTLCFTMDEMLAELDIKRFDIEARYPIKEFLQKILDEHYNEAKATDSFFEFISEPYFRNYCLRLIGIHYRSQFWSGWTQVTIQITEKKQRKATSGKNKGKIVDSYRILHLGYHVERIQNLTLLKEVEV